MSTQWRRTSAPEAQKIELSGIFGASWHLKVPQQNVRARKSRPTVRQGGCICDHVTGLRWIGKPQHFQQRNFMLGMLVIEPLVLHVVHEQHAVQVIDFMLDAAG